MKKQTSLQQKSRLYDMVDKNKDKENETKYW